MKQVRWLASATLAVIGVALLLSDWIRPDYITQFRELSESAVSLRFPLGTDSLGRDLLARTLHGARVSMLLAAGASLASVAIASSIGGLAGYLGGLFDRCVMKGIDLMLSLPWLFLLIAARGLLPLDVAPSLSIAITFTVLALLGWAAPARVIRAGVIQVRTTEFVLYAKASGYGGAHLFCHHVLPNLRPVLVAQFWSSIPLFILGEANLGFLGLGISEPMPSWGNLLRDLETRSAFVPGSLAPLVLLVIVVCCLKVMMPKGELQS